MFFSAKKFLINNLTAKEKQKTKQESNTGLKNKIKTERVSDLKKILKGIQRQKKLDIVRTNLSVLNRKSSFERRKNVTVMIKAGKKVYCKKFTEKFSKKLTG